MPFPSRLRLGLIVFCWLLYPFRLSATSIIFPTFSRPIIGDGLLYVVTANRGHLLAIHTSGGVAWRRDLGLVIGVRLDVDGRLKVGSAASLHTLDARTGETLDQVLFDEDYGAMGGPDHADGLLALWSRDWLKDELAVLDSHTGKIIRREPAATGILHATPDLVVFSKARRVPLTDGYTHDLVWIEARARSDWRSLWKAELKNRASPSALNAWMNDQLLVSDGADILFIDPARGETRRASAAITPPPGFTVGEVRFDQETPYYLATGPRSAPDHDRTRHLVYRCALPDLVFIETIELQAIEIALVSRHGDRLVSDALYRTIGYDSGGTRRWTHFQMSRTEPVGDVFYFSDHHQGNARVGSINIASGAMTVLHEEKR